MSQHRSPIIVSVFDLLAIVLAFCQYFLSIGKEKVFASTSSYCISCCFIMKKIVFIFTISAFKRSMTDPTDRSLFMPEVKTEENCLFSNFFVIQSYAL